MAYAAAISLMHTIDRLKISNHLKSTKSAYDELKSLVRTLKGLDDRRCRGIDRSVVNGLDEKIRDAVWELEDLLDESFRILSKTDIESCMETVTKLKREYSKELSNPSPGEEEEEDDAEVTPMHESATVGLSDQSARIRNELLHGMSELKTVSLLGMAGIGKTRLASEIFQHPLIVRHFDFTLWVRVGPVDEIISNIIVDIAAQIELKPRYPVKEKSLSESEYALRELIQNHLCGKRYIIVLDDIWSTQVLDCFAEFLPDDLNRSRVLLTTRLQEVAEYRRCTKVHRLPFLSNEESWNLLWQTVFVDEKYFPSQLEKAGRKIAEHCEGLPLLILSVANILCGLDKTEEFWMKVAEKKTSTFTDAYDQIYKVLLPSYEFLPQYLKPCFLYMGVFPQSCKIPSTKLINLWAAEGFLESVVNQYSEEFSLNCMEGLVSRSLAIVCKRSFDRFKRIKCSKLHCAYWHLCVKEAGKNKFFHVLKKLADVFIEKRPRRLSVQNNILFGIKGVYDSMAETTSKTRSLLCTGEYHQYPVRICLKMMKLLKVLDALAIRLYEFPIEVLKLLQLMYLSLTHYGKLPYHIYKLEQLQCLILRRHHNIKFKTDQITTLLPEKIWDMQELRHLRIMGSNLPDPKLNAKLPKLLTLYVNATSCTTKDVFISIPALKKLGITIELQPDAAETIMCLEHIGVLKNLESLKCVVVNPRLRSRVIAPPHHLSNFPRGLVKLSLNGLGYSWVYMSDIGSLPSLEVLKLRCCAFQGPHWETKAGLFKSLDFMLLEDMDLVHWRINNGIFRAESVHKCFRSLRHLTVRHCYRLKMIPSEIGDTRILERMEVDDCSPSVVASAQKIKDRAKSFDLQLVINSSWNL